MADIHGSHSSANSNVLRSAASPEALDAALRASEAADEIARAHPAPAQHAPVQQPAPALEAVGQVAGDAADIVGQSSRSAQAVFQAATALAEGGQDAARAWLELAQNATRTNVEALSRVAECRSWWEMMYVQGSVLQESSQQSVECGETVLRASTGAIRRAAQAMHEAYRPPLLS